MEQAFQRKRIDTLSSSSLFIDITTTERDCDPVGKELLVSTGLRVVTGLVKAERRL